VFFVQNEKLAFWREKRKKKEFPKTPLSKHWVARGRSSHKSWLFPSQNQNRVVLIRDTEEVVVRFLRSERAVSGVQRVLKTHHDR
jgi:hypothetical protein